MSATTIRPASALNPGRYFEAVSGCGSVAEAAPVCLYLEVTNRCNLLCETCPRTFEALEPPLDAFIKLARAGLGSPHRFALIVCSRQSFLKTRLYGLHQSRCIDPE